MKTIQNNYGIVDNRFLARSIGLLDPNEPLSVHEEDSVEDAIKLLQKNRIGGLVVINDESKICGIFTERDVVLKICLNGMDLENTPVSKVMTPNPHTEEMTTSIAFALNMMSQGGYRHIPLVDEQEYPVGMISVKDIVDYIVSELTKELPSTPTSAPA